MKRKIQMKIAKFKNLIKLKNHNFFLHSKNIKAKLGFFIFRAMLKFIKSKQIFVKVPILHYFDLKYHIWIEIDISRYAIKEILS